MQHMRPYVPIILLALVISTASAQGSSGGLFYITHVTVIDTVAGREMRDRTVIISDDRIADIVSSRHSEPLSGARVVDGTGKYLIPGLWDMHVHGNNQPWFASVFPLYLANGVTGVREMFGPPDANQFRAELASMHTPAPHVYLASPIVDGHPKVWPNSVEVNSPDEAREFVRDQRRKGADFIKVYSRLKPKEYLAIVDESRKQHLPVAGHVPNQVSAWEAVSAKQTSFEHLYGIAVACSTREAELFAKIGESKSSQERAGFVLEAYRSYTEKKCRNLFSAMKRNGSWGVPTLSVYRAFASLTDPQFKNDPRLRFYHGDLLGWLTGKGDTRLANWTPEDRAREEETFESVKKMTGVMFRAGVPLLAGTDCGNPYTLPGFGLHDELVLLVDSGLTPLAALQAATVNAAVFMRARDKYGSVARGKIADLVLLDADPLADIHNTARISAVFLGGREFDRAALDQLLQQAERSAPADPSL